MPKSNKRIAHKSSKTLPVSVSQSQGSIPWLSLAGVVVFFCFGYFLVRSLIATPDVNEVGGNTLYQLQNHFNSAAPSGMPTFSPMPVTTSELTGNGSKVCIIKCVLGGTTRKRCESKCQVTSTAPVARP